MKPAKLFIGFLVAGCVTIVFAVVLPRVMDPVQGQIIGAMAVLIITSLLVVAYAIIVAYWQGGRHLNTDCADYAYYLGFSLTVFALVIIFMGDGVALYLGAKKVKLSLESILIQFGAGLMATMVGVVARVMLVDKVNQEDVPIDESLRRFRLEMMQLVNALREQNGLYISEVGAAIRGLSTEIGEMQSVTLRVKNSLISSASEIAAAVDVSGLQASVQGLANNLRSSMEQMAEVSKEVNADIANFAKEVSSIEGAVKNAATSMANLTADVGAVSNQLQVSSQRLASFGESVAESSVSSIALSGSLSSLTGATSSISNALPELNQQATQMTQVVSALIQGLVLLHESGGKNLGALAAMKGSVSEIQVGLVLLVGTVQQLSSELETVKEAASAAGNVFTNLAVAGSNLQARL